MLTDTHDASAGGIKMTCSTIHGHSFPLAFWVRSFVGALCPQPAQAHYTPCTRVVLSGNLGMRYRLLYIVYNGGRHFPVLSLLLLSCFRPLFTLY